MNTAIRVDTALERVARLNGGVIRLARGDQSIDRMLAEIGPRTTRNWLSQLLGELVHEGRVVRVAKGLYVVPSERGRINPVAAAPRLTAGTSYVSMWNVAERAHLTFNQPRLVSVIVDQTPSHAQIEMPNLEMTFFFHRISKSRFFGFTQQPLGDGLTAPLASAEKALIDMLWFTEAPDTPPASEIFAMWAAAAGSTSLNPKLLVRYAKRMESSAIARRVGYLMERFGISGADELRALRGRGHHIIPLAGTERMNLQPNSWGVG